MADDEATEKEAWQLYRGVFEEGLEPAERIETLERVATDYPDTAWADDALWVLSEVARKRGDARRAILFERQLLERDAAPSLETFTLRQNIYARSRLPHVLFVPGNPVAGLVSAHEARRIVDPQEGDDLIEPFRGQIPPVIVDQLRVHHAVLHRAQRHGGAVRPSFHRAFGHSGTFSAHVNAISTSIAANLPEIT